MFCLVIFNLDKVRASNREVVDLSGEWFYRLSEAPVSIAGEGYINLPGTLDQQHKSVYHPVSENTSQLRREFSFEGEAIYSREIDIPADWRDKEIILSLERTKPSTIKIDGEIKGRNSRILSPQKFDLSGISPGVHLLEIVVNNSDSIPPIVRNTSNATSESTQTNWNGILGDMILEARNQFNIKKISIDDEWYKNHISINLDFSEEAPDEYSLFLKRGEKNLNISTIRKGASSHKITIPMQDIDLWSNSDPQVCTLVFSLRDKNKQEIDKLEFETGFRRFSTRNGYFTINGNPVFLRGTVNSAVFPATAYVPMDNKSWLDYFSALQEYGINHVRFHSWTPPEAAFEAADQKGIYLLVELPLWGEMDRDLEKQNRFLREELKGIMEAYAHHPSFVMFSPGNELWGDISLMGEYMNEARHLNPRVLSTYGSNVYLGMNGEIGGEDFMISYKTGREPETAVRGSMSFVEDDKGGFLNSNYPANNFNYNEALQGINVPVISHEVGQYQIYPDYNQIEKYKGNLKPDNLKEFQRHSLESGTLRKSDAFKEASGKWASILYKAEIEAALRSEGLAGVELFGIQDYPGQGGAFVGMLDAFMDSKKIVDPKQWLLSFSDLSVIALLPKYSFESGEELKIPLKSVNFTSNPDTVESIVWNIGFDEGYLPVKSGTGINEAGEINLTIPEIKFPEKRTLTIKKENGKVLNSYDVWVFPRNMKNVKNVVVTTHFKEAMESLEKGKRVIFCPDSALVSQTSIDPLFVPDFLNYQMYHRMGKEMGTEISPGTLGLLIKETNGAFRKFPTEGHTNWQWYPVVSNSRPLIIDRLPEEVDPLIEVIDNPDRNYRLALLFECKVGKGSLLILPLNLDESLKYPEGRWFLQSLKEYAASKEFNPSLSLTPVQVENLLTKASFKRRVKELREGD